MNQVDDLLRQRIGLDAATVGSALIERTVRLRLKALGLPSMKAYVEHLESSPAEWEELVEAVVVTETWFFRDHEPFNAFVQLVQAHGQGEPDRPVRILSLPCSTGEEPYSLAMALLDAGLPRQRWQIEAVDLSARALVRARRAVYSRNSFRGKNLAFRDRHFRAVSDGYQLHPDIQSAVQFRRGNLLDDSPAALPAPYDFIFCRNLLIYFDRPTQRLALRKLHRFLADTGVLFVGPAEMPLASEHGFAPVGMPMAFACRKAVGEMQSRSSPPKARTHGPKSKVSWPLITPPSPAQDRPPTPSPIRAPESLKSKAGSSTTNERSRKLDLATARALADAGQLREAAALCEAHLATHGPNAQAYYLLGLITEADASANHPDRKTESVPHAAHRASQSALDYYRKALYLKPDHYESLLQLSLLLEKQGDVAGARTYRRRAARLQQKGAEG